MAAKGHKKRKKSIQTEPNYYDSPPSCWILAPAPKLLTAYRLPLTAHCLPLTAHCSLLTAHCLPLTSFDHRRFAAVKRQRHTDNDHQSQDALLKISVNAYDVHAVFHDSEDQCSDQRIDWSADAAG
jgi:hypothetical protein